MTTPNNRPNILLIMTDQQRWDSLGCYGETALATPNLDRLAADGACFEQCYTTNPICTPARASLMTGKHILEHGVTRLYDVLPDDEILFTERLQQAGYQTALFGKLHVSSGVHEQTARHPHDGFDIYEYCIEASVGMESPFNGYVKWLEKKDPVFLAGLRAKRRGLKHIPAELHFTRWAADSTIDFLVRADRNRPFFCMMSVFDPHNPYDDYPLSYAERIDRTTLRSILPPAAEDAAIYALSQERELSYLGPADEFSHSDIEAMRLGYYASLAFLDDEVGRVLASLVEQGLADDTLVIFVSDHGDSLGDHGLFVKGVHLYDEGIRVPLLMRWPGRIPPQRRIGTPVQLNDLAATILAAAGIACPDAMPDALDLLPLATAAPAATGREYAVCAYRNTGISDRKSYFDPPIHSTMIRDARFKLILYHAVPQAAAPAYVQLFDMVTDPHEQVNLADDPGIAGDKARLLLALAEWLDRQTRGLESRGGEVLPNAAWKAIQTNRL